MTPFVINQPVTLEETRFFEFKEIKGANPVNTIKNICDEYVVAFLNRGGGSIFWGIRNHDRAVVGVVINYQERDKLRKEINNKIGTIKPSISPSAYQVDFHEVLNEKQCAIENCYVVEIVVPKPIEKALYSTGSNEVFIKTDSGIKKLTIPEIEDEILRRKQWGIDKPSSLNQNQSDELDLQVGIGDDYGYDSEIMLQFQSFYEDTDISNMFVQVREVFVSKFIRDEYYRKIRELDRREIFFDGRHIGKTLKWITGQSSAEKISLQPNETAYVLLLEDVSDTESLRFGFDVINLTEELKKTWDESGTYEVYVDVYGKIHNEIKYRKRTFVVLIEFRKGWGVDIERLIDEKHYQKWFNTE